MLWIIEMVEAMQDMFITYLKPIQEKIEIGLQNKVIQNKWTIWICD